MAGYARRAIMDACVRLLEERPVSKISVKDVVEECGINRNTFYYHFQDLPSLIAAIVQEDADRIIQAYAAVGSLEECVQVAVKFTLKNRRAIMHIYHSADREIYERSLMNICQHTVAKYVNAVCGDRPVRESDKRIIIQAYQCECFGHIIDWLDGGLQEDFPKDFLRLCELRKGAMEEMFRRSLES